MILMDFDGTLVDNHKALFLSYFESAKEFGYQIDYETFKTKCFGKSSEFFLTYYFDVRDEDVSSIINLKRLIYPNYFDYISLNNELYKNYVYKKDDFRILSHANFDDLIKVVNYFNLEIDSSKILTKSIVGHSKSEELTYQIVANLLDCKVSDMHLIDDDLSNIEAARRAGLKVTHFK